MSHIVPCSLQTMKNRNIVQCMSLYTQCINPSFNHHYRSVTITDLCRLLVTITGLCRLLLLRYRRVPLELLTSNPIFMSLQYCLFAYVLNLGLLLKCTTWIHYMYYMHTLKKAKQQIQWILGYSYKKICLFRIYQIQRMNKLSIND